VVAPALFDRIERGVELGYEGADLEKGMSFIPKLDIDNALLDIAAAMAFAASETGKKVGVIGYCFGGTLAWVAAARLRPAVAVGYYAGRIGNYVSETLHAPVMLHFGKLDAHIPPEEVAKIHAAHPEVEIYWYDAGHGFSCDARASFEPLSAFEARKRSLDFLRKYLE
jgi:carboxymethylenebutenolidase